MKKKNVFIHLLLILIGLLCVAPLWLVVSTSLMHEKDITTTGYSFFPQRITFIAFETVLKDPSQLIQSYAVTAFVTIVGTIAGLWLTASIAYVMTRRDYKYRNKLSLYIFFTMLFNGGLVPSFILISNWLGLYNNVLALILPYLVNAWFVLLMKGFLQSIPSALIESAKIDGAGELRIFVGMILPIAKPALATVGLFMVLQYWNDWWLTMLYIDNEKLYTLQYLLIRVMKNLEFLNTEYARVHLNLAAIEIPTLSARMAMSVLAAGPMLFIFPFFQKYFVKGLTVGSVKG